MKSLKNWWLGVAEQAKGSSVGDLSFRRDRMLTAIQAAIGDLR